MLLVHAVMPPKRKPVSKASGKPKKEAEPGSPVRDARSEDERPITPLLERIRRKSGDGKPTDLNMSAASSVEHGSSPAWKKSRNEETVIRAQSEKENEVVSENQADARIAELEAELLKLRQDAERMVSREILDKEVSARSFLEQELDKARREREAAETSSRRRTGSKDDRRTASLERELQQAREERLRLEEEVARITEEKEQLENQYDDALNSTLISFKSPARLVPASARKSIGRLSLSGYADEFASLGASNAEMDALTKKAAELEHIVQRQAEEIERLIKRGSVDDSYDIEGLDQKYTQLQDHLDSERAETTKFREEASRLSGLVESLTSEKSVLLNRVRKYQEDELAYEATIAELESLQAECIAMRSEVETYKKRVFNADQTIEQLSRHVETSKNHIFSLEDRLKTSERDLEAQRFDNSALEQVLTRKNTVLNTELNNARTDVRKLRDEAGEAKTLNHKLKQENIDLSTSVQRWQSRSGEFEAKFHDAETEAKRAKAELESIKRETAVAIRNAEIREQEMTATLVDNQNELGNMSIELRNVRTERDHLVNQVRNMTDQINEMKHSAAEVMNETQKKHEAELVAIRQKSTELESLLQSARREKAHYESQFKALQKQGSLEVQAVQARARELEQALETQKKLNERLQRDSALGVPITSLAEQIDANAVVGKPVTLLGSPAIPAQLGSTRPRELQSHVSQPLEAGPSPTAKPQGAVTLQRHPTAPTSAEHSSSTSSVARPLVQRPSAGGQDPSANPLAFWRAKMQQQSARPPVAPQSNVSAAPASVTPVIRKTPTNAGAALSGQKVVPGSGVKKTGTTPAAVPSPLLKVRRTGDEQTGSAPVEEPVSAPKRLSMVQEVRKELEGNENELSPIMAAARPDQPFVDDDAEELVNINKENSDHIEDNYMRMWNTALSVYPPVWHSALSRVPGTSDKFQFGSRVLQCKLIGSDMLVIEGKSQMLIDRYLSQHGESIMTEINGSQSISAVGAAPPALTAASEPVKKSGLRFKNLRKQPLGQANDMESQS
jgi:predicted  nucleic acid-binding Zn-ribbon protein